MPNDYSSLYQSAGQTFNVDPLLARAIAHVETGGEADPARAVSRDARGNPVAHGVMQLTAPNLRRLNVIDPYNPEYNIPAGTRVLDEALTAAKGNVPLALRIYQGGADPSKWGPQNAAYPMKVAAAYQALKASEPSGTGTPQDDTDAFLTGKFAPAAKPAPNVGDDIDAFLSGNAVATPNELAGAPGKPGQIDPLTGRPFQFVGNVPANDAVGQSTGKPIAEGKLPGVRVQAAASVPVTEDGRRRVIARELFPDKPEAEALSRVFYGPDGRMAAVGESGQPFYVDPIPSHAPGLFDPYSPTSIARSIPTDNPLSRLASMAGEVPTMVGAGIGGALTGGNPLAVGTGAGIGDMIRQEIAKYVDPQSPGMNLRHAAITGAQYGTAEGAGRAVSAFIPRNALASVAPPASGPFSAAGRLADEPRHLPDGIQIIPPGGISPASGNPLAAPRVVSAGEGGRANPLSTIAPAPGLDAADAEAHAAGWRRIEPGEPTAPGQEVATDSRTGRQYVRAQPEPPAASPNPHLEGLPPPGASTPLSREEAEELAAIPESLPRPTLPIVTKAQAEAHADKVIRAMAGIGNREATSSPFAGSHGTLADLTGNAGIATLQRGFEGAVDSTPFVALRARNNAARAAELTSLAGTPADIAAAEGALDARTSAMRNAAFANKAPVDAQPLADEIARVLASPEGKRAAVQKTVQSVRDRLFDADGNLETRKCSTACGSTSTTCWPRPHSATTPNSRRHRAT